MPVQLIDVMNHPEIPPGGRKKIFFSSEGYHVWLHGESPPGNKNHMHKHTADEMFYCLRGECVFHLIDGSQMKLIPGKMILIPKGEPYRIESTGKEYLALLGTRGERDGMQRWDAQGKAADRDTEEGKQLAVDRPPIDGRTDI